MTTTASAPPASGVPVDIAARLDQIAAQLDVLAQEVARQRLEREKWREFQDDMMPVARAALASLGGDLEAVQGVASAEDLLRLARKLGAALPAIEGAVGQLDSLRELGADAAPLLRPAFATLTERLADLDERGYFRFAKSGVGVVDRIVTSFSDEDVEALGDNVVLILQTVRDMTQPEVMSFLRRTMQSVQEEETPSEPPSLFGLFREMRDPQVRRGLARALGALRSMSEAEAAGAGSAEATPVEPANTNTHTHTTDGNGR